MHALVVATDVRLAALVKEHFDRRRVGLTEILPADALLTGTADLAEQAPSAILLVGHRADSTLLDVCRLVVRTLEADRVPLVVAVDEAREIDRIALLDAGADIVVQPFDLVVVEHRLRASRERRSPRDDLRGRSLSIDAREPVVTAEGRRVVLTAREAAVLRLLVHRSDAVVSRAEIEQRIWGAPRSRTLDVHVARLRRKLGRTGRCIQTVSRVGYRFVEPR